MSGLERQKKQRHFSARITRKKAKCEHIFCSTIYMGKGWSKWLWAFFEIKGVAQLVEGRVQTIFLAKNFGMHFMKGLSICNHMGYSKKSPLGTTRFIKFQITFLVLLYIIIVSVFYIRNCLSTNNLLLKQFL